MASCEEGVHVLPMFVLPGQVVFPYERLTLDARTGANIALFAALHSRSSRRGPSIPNDAANFTISMDFNSPFGTVATIDVNKPKPSWVGGAFRLHAVCLFTYELTRVYTQENINVDLGPWCPDRGYSVCTARRRRDLASPHIPLNCFVLISKSPFFPRHHGGKNSQTLTRSRAKQNARRLHKGVRTSLIDISASTWAAYNETALLARVRAVACTREKMLNLDYHLLNSRPSDTDMPAQWSFWFAAALSGRMSEAEQVRLLRERIPALRLRQILSILQTSILGKRPRPGSHSIRYQECRNPYQLGVGRSSEVAKARNVSKSGRSSSRARSTESKGSRQISSMSSLPVFDDSAFSRLRKRNA